MGFFDSIKKFKNQLEQVESSVYSGSGSLLEVYERNAKLEAEIAARTKELDRANKQMLTLHPVGVVAGAPSLLKPAVLHLV